MRQQADGGDAALDDLRHAGRLAYHQLTDNAAGTVTRRITGLGGNYAVTKEAKVSFGYMKRDDKGSAQSNSVYNLGINYTIAPTVVLAANLTQDRQSGVTLGKRTVTVLGADFILSKRTDVYALATREPDVSPAFPAPSYSQ